MADIKQWVNLTRDPKWPTHLTGPDKPADQERCGPIHLKVKFKNGNHASFKTRVKQKGTDPRYNRQEENRNQNFQVRYANGASTNLGKGEVQLERDIYLLAAGGAEFEFEAKHKKKEVKVPKTIETRRGLFYYSVRQDSTGAPNGTLKGGNVPGQIADPAPLLTQLENEHWTSDHPYYIRLERKGAYVVPFTDTLGNEYDQDGGAVDPNTAVTYTMDQTNRLWRNQNEQFGGGAFSPLGPGQAKGPGATRTDPANPANWFGVFRHTAEWAMLDGVKGAIPRADAQALKPYCFVIVWCNYIADRGKRIIVYKPKNAAGSTNFSIASKLSTALFTSSRADSEFEIFLGSWAWHGFNAAADAAKSWLVNVTCRWLPKGGGAPQSITIPRHAVDLSRAANWDFGGYAWIKVKLTAPELDGIRNRIFSAEGEFEFTVTYYCAKNMTCGYAMPGLNVVVVCDKAWWEKMDDKMKLGIVAHELGHAMGMTAQGGKPPAETFNGVNATTPDFPATLYGNIQNGRNENSCGHQGNHCSKGATWTRGAWDATAPSSGNTTGRYQGTWSGSPKCVMFGQIGLNGVTNPSTYCGDCKKIVRKLDLGGNLFASCITD